MICLQRLSLQGGRGNETGLFASVIVLDAVLVGIFCHCLFKVNSVASHVVALSELHIIFAFICVVIGKWVFNIFTFRVFNIFFVLGRVWKIAVVTP